MLYVIRGTSLQWIKDYLTNRSQYVEYNNSKYKMGNISIGGPQGSIIGPFLFCFMSMTSLIYSKNFYVFSAAYISDRKYQNTII